MYMYTLPSSLYQTHKIGMTVSQSSNGYSLSVTNVTQSYMRSATDQARSLIITLRRTSDPLRLRIDIFISVLQNYLISIHSK